MDIINLFNTNNGAISAIATIILVIITAWYAFITQKMLKSSEKSLKEQTRPFIVAFIDTEDHFLKLSIKNFGLRPAKNVKIKFIPTLDELDKILDRGIDPFNHRPLLNQNYMPPGFEIKTTLKHTPEFVTNKTYNKNFLVEINYSDINENNYKEEYNLDLEQYIHEKKTVQFTNNYYLNEISKRLDDIRKMLKKG